MTRIAGDNSYYTFIALDWVGDPVEGTEIRFESITSVIKSVTGGGWGPGSYRGFKLGIRSQHPRMSDERIEQLYTKAKRGEWDPNRQLKAAGDRGTKAHWVAESVALGYEARTWTYMDEEMGRTRLLVRMVPDDPFMDGYCVAALAYLRDRVGANRDLIWGVEKLLVSTKHQVAGTADLILKDTGSGSGMVEIIDYKTHKPNTLKRPAFWNDFLQLEGYELLFEEMHPELTVTRSTVVVLREDGTYLEETRPWTNHEGFLAILEAHRAQKEAME